MGIVLASNFDVKTGLSLDSRYNADTILDRNSIPVGIRYDGMQCYVKEDESLYILSGNDLSDNNNWTKSPYAKDYMPISGGTFTGQVDWYFGGDDTLELSISKDNGIVSRNDYTSSAGSKLVIAGGEITITDNYGDFKTILGGNGLRLCEYGQTPNDIVSGCVAIGGNNKLVNDTCSIGINNTVEIIDGYNCLTAGRYLSITSSGEGMYQIFGQYNEVIDSYPNPEGANYPTDKNIFIIGVGTSDTNRKNGLVLYPTGNLDILGDIKLFAGTSNEIPSLKNYIDNMVISANGLRYKGNLVPTSTTPGKLTPAGSVGDMYLSTGSGYINGVKVESGDMIICCTDTAAATSSTYSTIKNNWNIIQANVDVMKGATSTAAGQAGLVPMPEATTETQFLSNAGTWKGITTNNISHGDSETLNSWISETETNIGDLTTLTTTNKDSLVEAVNEVSYNNPRYFWLTVTPSDSTYTVNNDAYDNRIKSIRIYSGGQFDQDDTLTIKEGNRTLKTFSNFSMEGVYLYEFGDMIVINSGNLTAELSSTSSSTYSYLDITIETVPNNVNA